MDEIEYKAKYMKYKNKYLELKKLENNHNNQNNTTQSGGNYFSRGIYVLFLNKYQISPDNTTSIVLEPINQTRVIKDFGKFTDKLGPCTLFLRIGSTTTGYDINHDYDTIYPNTRSSGEISTNLSEPENFGSKTYQAIRNFFVGSDSENTQEQTQEETQENTMKGGYTSFEIKYLCYYKPIKLIDIGFENSPYSKGFKYTAQIENLKILADLVQGINSKIVVPKKGNQISTVLIINKLGNFSSDAEIYKRYDISDSTNLNLDSIKEYKYSS